MPLSIQKSNPRDCSAPSRAKKLTLSYRHHGFTMLELVIAVSLAMLLGGLAVPSMSNLISSFRVSATSNDILTSLYTARSYALTQQTYVHLCKRSNNNTQSCSQERDYNTNWSQGWYIFVDKNRNHELDKEDTLISEFIPHESVNVIFNQRGRLRYFSDGSARSSGFYVCDQQKRHYKHVFLLHSGRARINGQLSDQRKTICDEAS